MELLLNRDEVVRISSNWSGEVVDGCSPEEERKIIGRGFGGEGV